jgi:hypothetical protein
LILNVTFLIIILNIKLFSLGLVSTLAGGNGLGGLGTATGSSNGLGTYAGFYNPRGISSPDSNGNIYVADHYNHLIRKIDR